MCSKSYSGSIFTQHIPLRLSNIVHVPFPDVLHLYNQSLNGLSRLAKQVDYFRINEDCIGINENHVAKVWHSPNFSQLRPHVKAGSEAEMVRNIVDLIQSNTDQSSMPRQQPSFSQFLYRDNERVGFGEAKKKLEQYANYFNRGVIPNYLACVERAGGARNIRNKWSENNLINSNINPSNSIVSHEYQPPLMAPVTSAPHFGQPIHLVSSSPQPLPNSAYMGPPPNNRFFQSQTFAPRSRSRL